MSHLAAVFTPEGCFYIKLCLHIRVIFSKCWTDSNAGLLPPDVCRKTGSSHKHKQQTGDSLLNEIKTCAINFSPLTFGKVPFKQWKQNKGKVSVEMFLQSEKTPKFIIIICLSGASLSQ